MTWLLAHQPILLAISVAATMFTNVGNAVITAFKVEQVVEQSIEQADGRP
jgi:hypothetical protein